MKKILLLLTLAFTITANAQDDKTVTLTVSGQGKTQDEAKQVALRSAIEQAFGTFISSKTEILNDNLVKDEIVSVANGNIQKFEIISEVQIPNGGYATSLKATVSVTKLTSFVESKGVVVDFKGGLFAENIKLQNLYESNEFIAVDQICTSAKKMFNQSFDYDLRVSQPVASKNNGQIFEIKMAIDVNINNNYSKAAEYVFKSLQALSCSKETIKDYQELKKRLLVIHFVDFKGATNKITLRNVQDKIKLIDLFNHITSCTYNFQIASNVEKVNMDNQQFNGMSETEIVQKNIRNSWYLYGGRENPEKIKYKTAFVINDYYKEIKGEMDICYSYYAGVYGPNIKNQGAFQKDYFPLCFERKEFSNSIEEGLVVSLFNPLGKYVTTHAIIHTANLEIIQKTSEYKVVKFD